MTHRQRGSWCPGSIRVVQQTNPKSTLPFWILLHLTLHIVRLHVSSQLYKDQRRNSENASHKSSDSDVSDVSAISRTSSASRISSTSYMSIQSERPRGRFRYRRAPVLTPILTFAEMFYKKQKKTCDIQQGHARDGPPHDEEHQRERRDLRHGARRRQPVGHGAREPRLGDQGTAFESQPARRRHPPFQTQPQHLATQPDRSEGSPASRSTAPSHVTHRARE